MAYLKPLQQDENGQWQRLLHEKVGGDREAAQQVEALIERLRRDQQWQAAPPAPGNDGRVPHS